MSAVTNIWRQLVQRRLWPVAILLLAALVAVPLTLAKDPEPAPVPSAPAATGGKDELAVTPIVAKAAPEDRGARRRVLGAAKNPFKVKKADDGVVSSDQPTGSSGITSGPGGGVTPAPIDGAGGGDTGGGGAAPTAPSAPAPTTPAEPKPPVKTYAPDELTVRFGGSDAGGERQSLERLQPLPSAEQPVLIYLGLLKDGKTAEFLVDHGVQAIGDGECRPSPELCETLRLRAGDTEFLDVVDATGAVGGQFQLDLIKVHNSKQASASRARSSSKAGRRVMSARVATAGGWDAGVGALRATVAGATAGLR